MPRKCGISKIFEKSLHTFWADEASRRRWYQPKSSALTPTTVETLAKKGRPTFLFITTVSVPLMSWTISMKLLGSVFECHACFFSPKSICWGECCINLCQQSIRKLMRALIYLFMYLPPFPELDSTLTLLFIFTANKRTNGTMNTWDHYSWICATKSIQGHSTRHWALVNSTHVERQQQKSFTLLWCDDRIPGKRLPHVI